MRCDKVKELLMTDYIDGQLDGQTEKLVRQHLESCAACRAFEASVRKSAVEPLKAAAQKRPPAYVWERIRREVYEEKSSAAFGGLKERLGELFAVPRLRLAAVTVAMVVIVFAFVGYQRYADQRALDTYIDEQASFLSDLGNGGIGAEEDYLEMGDELDNFAAAGNFLKGRVV